MIIRNMKYDPIYVIIGIVCKMDNVCRTDMCSNGQYMSYGNNPEKSAGKARGKR